MASDADRQGQVEHAYNRHFKGYVAPTYDAEPLTLARWVRDGVRLHPHQVAGAGWGPNVRMGKNLRIQAASGHRAAVIDLKPGLYLVAELPEAVTRTEFGIAPLLAPLMVRAAKKAIDEGKKPPDKRGPLAALFTKKVREQQAKKGPIRLFRAREAQPVAQADAPKQLTGPVAAPGLQPQQGAGSGRTFLLPAPNVGWADDDTVAELLGCEACDGEWSG